MPGKPVPGAPAPGGGGATTRPPATASYTPPPLAPARPGVATLTLRHDGSPLPNVLLEMDQWREFEVPSATFRYAWPTPGAASSAFADPLAPGRVEDCFPVNARGPRVVRLDDRIRVVRPLGNRRVEVVFDGYLVAPEAALGPDVESVTLAVAGTPIREFDAPLAGAWVRDSDGLKGPPAKDDADPSRPQDVRCFAVPTRFNPDGRPNATPAEFEGVSANSVLPGTTTTILQEYPVFADVELPEEAGLRHWTLPMAVKYCMCVANPDQAYVHNGDLDRVDALLVAVRPTSPSRPIDMSDPGTYVADDIVVPDLDVTGMAWPDAVRRLIEPHGFAFRFVLETGPGGTPRWSVAFFRKDDALKAKPAYLQKAGARLVPGRSTASELRLARDGSGIRNAWVVNTEPIRREASFVLAPLFVPDPADASDVARRAFFVQGIDATVYDPGLYRRFGLAEAGDPYYDLLENLWRDEPDPTDLRVVLTPTRTARDPRTYVRRRRKPLATLASRDPSGRPRRAELWVGTNYPGGPEVWDPKKPCAFGTAGGDWQRVTAGGWRLLEDRVGIELTAPDPRNLPLSKLDARPAPAAGVAAIGFPGAKLDVVACLNGTFATRAVPSPTAPVFWFRLTCMIEHDIDIPAVAGRRRASPTRFDRLAYVDARDRFQKHTITPYSATARAAGRTTATSDPDDTDAAEAEAEGRRKAHETATFAGSLTIPYLTFGYAIGDHVDSVAGRGISLSSNASVATGESPTYPQVVGFDRHWGEGQSITFLLSDSRAEAQPRTRGRAFRGDDQT